MKPSRKYCIDDASARKPKCGMTRKQATDAAQVASARIGGPVWIMRGVGGQLVVAGVCDAHRCTIKTQRNFFTAMKEFAR